MRGTTVFSSRLHALRVFVATGIVLGLVMPPSYSLAQTPDAVSPLRLTTSPVPIRLETTPGGVVATPLRIKNDGTSPETLSVSVKKFTANDTTGRPKLEDPLPTDAFVNWVTFSENQFTVSPNEWKTVNATFTVPSDAAFGYYYAIVFSRSTPQQASPDQTPVIGGTAVLVLLEARVPHAVREVGVSEFTTDKAWYEFLPVQFLIKLENKGNVHVAPRGNIFINRSKGTDLAILEVNPQQGSVLPGSKRDFAAAWNEGFPLYKPKLDENDAVLHTESGEIDHELTWDFSQADKLRWGRYTATMLLVYDDGQRDVPIESTVSFWVFPWRILIGLLVALLFILLGFYSTLRKLWRSIFRRGHKKPY